MGTRIAFNRAPALHDSNGWPVSLELSLAALLSSAPGDLRSGSAAEGIAANGCSYDGVYPDRFDGNRSVNLPDGRLLRCSSWLDFSWIGCWLVFMGIGPTWLRISIVGASCNYILRASDDVSLHADELRSSEIQFYPGTA